MAVNIFFFILTDFNTNFFTLRWYPADSNKVRSSFKVKEGTHKWTQLPTFIFKSEMNVQHKNYGK